MTSWYRGAVPRLLSSVLTPTFNIMSRGGYAFTKILPHEYEYRSVAGRFLEAGIIYRGPLLTSLGV